MTETIHVMQIVDWDEIHEVNRTRSIINVEWIPVRNLIDADPFLRMIDHPKGAEHYGVWIAMALVASKCFPRGVLLQTTLEPHTPETLARRLRIDQEIIQGAIDRFFELGWLEFVNLAPSKKALTSNFGPDKPSQKWSKREKRKRRKAVREHKLSGAWQEGAVSQQAKLDRSLSITEEKLEKVRVEWLESLVGYELDAMTVEEMQQVVLATLPEKAVEYLPELGAKRKAEGALRVALLEILHQAKERALKEMGE